MKLGSPKQIPLLIACAMIALVCLLASLPRAKKFESFDLSQRLEWITYDWRMRLAASHTSQAFATNLAFVEVGEAGISAVLDGVFGYQHGLYWPRHVYGRALRELTAQGAKAVAFDVLFDYLRPDHGPVSVPGAPRMGSDDFFADQIAKSGCVILAADKGSAPAERFLTNAWAVGDASSHLEPDGVRRRVHAFVDYPIWRPEIKQFARAMDLNLHSAKFEKDRIVFEKLGSSETGQPDTFEIALNPDGTVKAEDITGEPGKGNIQPRVSQRCWHMGIQLAARELGLDLSQSTVDLAGGKIVLRGKNGLERVIPVDSEGQFCIDWSLPYYDARIQKVEIQELLARDFLRHSGKTNQPPPRFQNKLVVIGSIAKGNDLSDVGASPLDKETFLVSKYWNVANSVIVGRFIRPPSWALESALILALGTLAALVTWRQQRLVLASVLTGLVAAIYSLIAARAFMDERIWLPMVSPLTSALAVHGALVTYRGIFEQSERRRVRSVFAKVVSPDVVTELLGDKRLQIGGARRNITVFFADVRGFTEFTDVSQANAENHVRQLGLTGKEAEEFYDQRAAETLKTVSLYLSIVADTIKKHNGTLDKYIGDCVMAFWGAPAADEQHAIHCVRAAIEAQRAIYAMNQERFAMNKRIEQENASRAATGLPALPPLALLTLGTGINTGVVTVGLMGSDAHILNYTVFGREVNVASRLEGVSGRGRIIISETTHAALLQDDPTLAATCIPQAATTVKGIRSAIKTYEVPWKETAPAVTAPTSSAPVPPTSPVAPAPPLPPSPPPTQTS